LDLSGRSYLHDRQSIGSEGAKEDGYTMKHIDELRIDKFRGLRDLKIEGLGQVNLFVGNNDSGKTSV